MSKKISAVVVGYGNRGQIYANYAITNPDDLQIVAVCDPDQNKRLLAQQRHGLTEDRLFVSFAQFVQSNLHCDLVINATMDSLHYQTAKEIISAGYDMLMEKPIVNNAEQLFELQSLAHTKRTKVFVGHVLRYTPFYKTVKQLILDGEIGKIISLEMNEHVCLEHYVTSYVRGRWGSEEQSGSGFLLAKSCHDLDLLCWLNGDTKPTQVASFGERKLFTSQNKPADATDYCLTCPHVDDCLYSCKKINLQMDFMPFLSWGKLNKTSDQLTEQQKRDFLLTDDCGKCVYTDKDLVDRQTVTVRFEDGTVGNFALIGGAPRADRYLHIVGTKGEIEGKLSSDKIALTKARSDNWPKTEIIDLSNVVDDTYGHSGGDFAIMDDLVHYLQGKNTSIALTGIDDSIAGHLCVFDAEKSRKSGKIIEIKM